eukprot:8815888-Ditylum_brightwellii.AAC.1
MLFHKDAMIDYLPDNAVQAKGSWLGPYLSTQAHITCNVAILTHAAPDHTSCCVYLQTLPRHAQRLLGTLMDQDTDAKHWMDALKYGSAPVATDGSVHIQKGYFTVVLSDGEMDCVSKGHAMGHHNS